MHNIYFILGETLVKTIIQTAFKSIFLFTLLCGVFYTLFVTVVGQLVFPYQANGSLIEKQVAGKKTVIGSTLIGQSFTGKGYLHGRPTTVSQLSSVSSEQKQRVADRVAKANDTQITIDLVTASASGLDPDITLAGALTQVERIAAARNMKKADIHAIIKQNTVGLLIGTVNTQRVNVLAVNQQLDDQNKG